jgi:CBS domain-containing protein
MMVVVMLVNVGAVCIRDVVIAQGRDPLLEVAKLMRHHHVGDVIIVERGAEANRPIGIITDRDIVLMGVVDAFDQLGQLVASDLITRPLVTVHERDTIDGALEIMQMAAVRRLVVVDDDAALVGILTVDDLIDVFAERLHRVSVLFDRGRRMEEDQRP